MGLLSGGNSSSKTYLTETNTDNSLADNQAQNLVGGGGSVGASDFAKALTINASGKGVNAASWDIQDGVVISNSSGNFTFDISTPPTQDAVTPEVLSSYINNASEEQIKQTNAKTTELLIKVGGAVAALVIILWLLKK